MREIKFRAWIRQGEWDEEGENQAYEMCYDLAFEEFEPINDLLSQVKNLMQYTGLKDKNGKEIYEGDIAKHPLCIKEPHSADESCEQFVGRIAYEADRGQYFAVNLKRNGYVVVLSEAYKFEVIGNIYENPELLGKGL